MAHMWKKLIQNVDIDEKTSFLLDTMCTGDALSVNANRMKQSLNSIRRCLSHVFLLILMKWKDMLENALSNIVNWHTSKWSNCSKYQVFPWMIINSSRKNSNLLQNCQKFAHKLSSSACTWHDLEDVTSQACETSHEMDYA